MREMIWKQFWQFDQNVGNLFPMVLKTKSLQHEFLLAILCEAVDMRDCHGGVVSSWQGHVTNQPGEKTATT